MSEKKLLLDLKPTWPDDDLMPERDPKWWRILISSDQPNGFCKAIDTYLEG